MRPANAALVAALAAGYELVVADLYTFRMTSGLVLRQSGFNTALVVPAAAFADPASLNYITVGSWTFALGPKFQRAKVSYKIGVEPANLDITIIPDPASDLIGTFTWPQAMRVGEFDGATVELDRYYMTPGSNAPIGALTWFYGRVSDTEIGRSKIDMKIESMMVLLKQQQLPRRLFGASCSWVFGGGGCDYDRVAGKNALGTATGIGAVAVTAQAGSSQATIITGFTPSPTTIYDNGTIIGTSGTNSGQSRTIKQLGAPNGPVFLYKPWLFPVATGDGFQLLPGCDHTVATCNGPLQNLARYGGWPYIPPPEVAV